MRDGAQLPSVASERSAASGTRSRAQLMTGRRHAASNARHGGLQPRNAAPGGDHAQRHGSSVGPLAPSRLALVSRRQAVEYEDVHAQRDRYVSTSAGGYVPIHLRLNLTVSNRVSRVSRSIHAMFCERGCVHARPFVDFPFFVANAGRASGRGRGACEVVNSHVDLCRRRPAAEPRARVQG